MESIKEYLLVTGMEAEQSYSKKEAEQIINEHAVSLYKGQLLLAEDRPYTGREIAEKLYGLEHAWEKLVEEWIEPVGV